MKYPLFYYLLLATGLLATAAPASAQKHKVQVANGSLPWFTVMNKLMVVQMGAPTKVLETDVRLPNGSRVEYQTQSVMLANGNRVRLKKGGLFNLSCELIQKSPTTVAPSANTTTSLLTIARPAPNAPAAPVPAPVAIAPAAATFVYRTEVPVNGKLRGWWSWEPAASTCSSFAWTTSKTRSWRNRNSATA